MRVRVSDPDLLGDLCGYLSGQGCICHETMGEGEADIVMPGARSSFEAATMLQAQIERWRGAHDWVTVELSPDTLV